MVKVYAPGLSLDASGSLGNAIVYSKWKGRHYIRERIIPSNPRSGLQVGFRAMFKFLAQQWTNLDAESKASWDTLAKQLNASPFNGYVYRNQRRWRNFKSPIQLEPATEAGTVGVPTATYPKATGGVACITISHKLDTANNNWGFMLFRSATATFDSALSNAIAVVLMDTTTEVTFVDSPLDPATYYYDTRLFTHDGVLGAEEGEISGTAT